VLDHGQLVAEGSEYDLRNKVKQALEIQVEWQVDRPELIPALQALAGVNRVEVSSGNGTCQAKLLCEKDLRAEVAKTIVAHEAGLLALARKEAELESLFLRLVNKEAANG
jgi:ABC-2 type transport system ATP-binding protein